MVITATALLPGVAGCGELDPRGGELRFGEIRVEEQSTGYRITVELAVSGKPFHDVSVVGYGDSGRICRADIGDISHDDTPEPVSMTCPEIPSRIIYLVDESPCDTKTTIEMARHDSMSSDGQYSFKDIPCTNTPG